MNKQEQKTVAVDINAVRINRALTRGLAPKVSGLESDTGFLTTLLHKGVRTKDLPRLSGLVSGPKWKRVYKSRIVADGKLHEETFKALKELRTELRLVVDAGSVILDVVGYQRALLDCLKRQAQAAESWWHGLSPEEQKTGLRAVRHFVQGNPERAYNEADAEGRIRLLAVAREGLEAAKLEVARRAAMAKPAAQPPEAVPAADKKSAVA